MYLKKKAVRFCCLWVKFQIQFKYNLLANTSAFVIVLPKQKINYVNREFLECFKCSSCNCYTPKFKVEVSATSPGGDVAGQITADQMLRRILHFQNRERNTKANTKQNT